MIVCLAVIILSVCAIVCRTIERANVEKKEAAEAEEAAEVAKKAKKE